MTSLIGVDVGTSNVKAIAYTPIGDVLAQGSVPNQAYHPRPGWAYYEPEELWERVVDVLRQVTAALAPAHQPQGIAITSMAETAVPLDAKGQPLYVAIAWFDRRTQEQVDWWLREVGADTIGRITGLPVQPIFGINKIMWLRDHEPSIYKRTDRWLNVADYIAYRLCGAQATDYSLAARMMALDLERRTWSQQILELAGIRHDILAELVPSGTRLGSVLPQAAQATGLPAGMPVMSGGHDHICGALALGITEPGDVLDSMGTAEGLMISLDRPVPGSELAQSGYAQGVHVMPERYYCLGGLYTSGACIDWVRQMLLPELDQGEGFAALIRLAERAHPSSLGVFFLPHLRMANIPPDPKGRGAFIGLSADTTRADLARAVLEGLAYEAHHSLSGMQQILGIPLQRVRAIGGSSRNPLLMQIKASISKLPHQLASVSDATTLGAAMLAGVGSGVYRDFADALARSRRSETVVEPDARLSQIYRERYDRVYKHIYTAVRGLHHHITDYLLIMGDGDNKG